MNSIDQQFIEYIVKSLVGHPNAVKIDRRIDEKGVLLELTVDPEDLGRVIGKKGATAQSLRTLLRALGTKNDARYNLKIVDVGGPGPYSPPSSDDNSSSKTEDDVPAARTREPEPVETAEEGKPEDVGRATDDDIETEESHSSVVDRTRRELADLDDLDV